MCQNSGLRRRKEGKVGRNEGGGGVGTRVHGANYVIINKYVCVISLINSPDNFHFVYVVYLVQIYVGKHGANMKYHA